MTLQNPLSQVGCKDHFRHVWLVQVLVGSNSLVVHVFPGSVFAWHTCCSVHLPGKHVVWYMRIPPGFGVEIGCGPSSFLFVGLFADLAQ